MFKPNDSAPVRWVRATRWQCIICDPKEQAGAYTTVVWIGALGRCSDCGQKMMLADPFDTHIPGDELPRKS